MLRTTDVARIIDAPAEADILSTIVEHLGLTPPLRIGRQAAQRFGLDGMRSLVRVSSGPDSVRGLLVDLQQERSVLEVGRDLARRVSHSAPDMLWIILVRSTHTGELLIVVPAPAGKGTSHSLICNTGCLRTSDAETIAALCSCRADTGHLLHMRWRETLGRDALSSRFYRDLEQCVASMTDSARGSGNSESKRTVAILTASRLLFLSFLEAKGWLNNDGAFLRHNFELAVGGKGAHERLLNPLFFGTLNTPVERRSGLARKFGQVPFLNGGLFNRTRLEKRERRLHFTDEAIGEVICGLLSRYRLTARETQTDWADAAIDPEMLGRAFESLMAKEKRRTNGAFYTPHDLVARITRGAIDRALESCRSQVSLHTIDSLKLIDPACGSGSFLVFALEELAERRQRLGDLRSRSQRRRHVLARNIFGVDIDPTAVWLCQLRLWLSVVVDDETDKPLRVSPLPNIDRNIREGDALSDHRLEGTLIQTTGATEALRLRYVRSNGVRKSSLARQLDSAERKYAIKSLERQVEVLVCERRDLLASARSPDLFSKRTLPASQKRSLVLIRQRLRDMRARLRALRDGAPLPFSFVTHFAQTMDGGGFDLAIGNPPWVRPHAVSPQLRRSLRERFYSCRNAAWESGASIASAGRGFASQVDLAAIFTERAVQLLKPQGTLAFLVPAKFWSSLSNGGLREYLRLNAPPVAIELFHDTTTGFDAAVYPSVIVARKTARADSLGTAAQSPPATSNSEPRESPAVLIRSHSAESATEWHSHIDRLPLEGSSGAPWLLVPEEVRKAFDILTGAGIPLAHSHYGRPLLGVKTGCNEAFVVEADGTIENDLLRPVLRGEMLRAWTIYDQSPPQRIIWAYDSTNRPLVKLPRHAKAWFSNWSSRLEARSDSRGHSPWTLFRTEGAHQDRPRVVWSDIGKRPRAVVLQRGDPYVPINSCYVVPCRSIPHAYVLAAILNSRIAASWLNVIAEPARGGYKRYMGWTCARLPIPHNRSAATEILYPLARRAISGEQISDDELDSVVARAYGFTSRIMPANGLAANSLAPLLSWAESQMPQRTPQHE